MSPTQFVTQRVTNWKCLIKQAHIAKVGRVEALAELYRQLFGQGRQQVLAILRSISPTLLKLDNVPANLPTGAYLNHIGRSQYLLACLLNQFSQAPQQRPETILTWVCLGQLIAHAMSPLVPILGLVPIR